MLREPYLDELDSGGGADGFDDMDLSDNTESIEAEETIEVTETVEETKPTEEVSKNPYKLKIKYNHDEIELGEDEAVPLIQKGMNYDKAVERAGQEAIDKEYADLYRGQFSISGKPILSKLDYENALIEKEMYDKYQNQGLPEDVIRELVESKKDREERKLEKQTVQEQRIEYERQQAIQQDANDFFTWFQEENGRIFEVGKDTMPPEAWQAHLEGKNLIAEYSKYENKLIKQELKTLKQNKENQKKAPVNGVTVHGADSIESEDAFLSGFNED